MLAPGLIALMASGCSLSPDPTSDDPVSGEEPWVGFGPMRLEVDGQVTEADVFATGGVELTGETGASLTVVLDGPAPDGSGFHSLSIELDEEIGAIWRDGHDLLDTPGLVDLQLAGPEGSRPRDMASCSTTMTHLGPLPSPTLPGVTYRRYAVTVTCPDTTWDLTFDALISVEA
ncbi:MAG: hypothetical protein AAF211_06165 [Myxococcota bacterium]